jgi:indole-3-glycerol phosphate synthase
VEDSTGYLTSILERKREELRAAPPQVAARGELPPRHAFAPALCRPAGLCVIAEVKRRSPVTGDIAPDLDVDERVRLYEQAGAAACSVLTDSGFDGYLSDLEAARSACSLPILRKDFLLDPRQCSESRDAGADAVLLIAAALPGSALDELLAASWEVGLETLVEVHREHELVRALEAGATLVGVNNRDLETFEVRLNTSLTLAPLFPPEVVRVSESGIASAAAARQVADAGYDAILVGEALVRSADPAALIEELSCG